MSKTNVENQAPQLCAAWYVIVNELWGLLLRSGGGADRFRVLYRISELENRLRPVIDGLTSAAEERGIDSTPLFELAGSLDAASDRTWDAAWALVKRLQAVQGIIPRTANASEWEPSERFVRMSCILHAAAFRQPKSDKNPPRTTVFDWVRRDDPEFETDPSSTGEKCYPRAWILACISRWNPRKAQ